MAHQTRTSRSPLPAHVIAAACLLLLLPAAFGQDQPAKLKQADRLFEDKNYKEAGDAYEAFLRGDPKLPGSWRATGQLVLCRLRMQEFDPAIEAAEQAVKRFAGNVYEARAEHRLGNLYLQIPHHGTIMAGKFNRGVWGQGRRVTSYGHDRKRAVSHLERARQLYAQFESDGAAQQPLTEEERAGYRKERIDCIFDLAAAATRFGPHDLDWHHRWYIEELEDDDTVGEYEDEQVASRRGADSPRGIPVDVAGKPIFDPVPKAYDAGLPLGQKMKYLLHEAERLDQSPDRAQAGLAVYRRAMLARARYAPERLSRWPWTRRRTPEADRDAGTRLWKLGDREVLTLMAGRLEVVQLPPDEDVLALLRLVVEDYANAAIAPEAQYAVGLYYQSREQYPQALKAYDELLTRFPKAARATAARAQKALILREEVVLGQTGVQLAGSQTVLDLTHRNANAVEFTARKVDLAACIRDLWVQLKADGQDTNPWEMQNLPQHLVNESANRYQTFYRKYVGEVAARWTATVTPDPDHRYKTEQVNTPLREVGCYLIEAKSSQSATCRAVLLVQDMALVNKKLSNRGLIYVCDAATGDPVPGASLTVYEYSREHLKRVQRGQRSWRWLWRERKLVANEMGVVEHKPERLGTRFPQSVIVAEAKNGRMAFSGMYYWGRYHRPGPLSVLRAYCLTDRPVYRPGQEVKFKVWARKLLDGEYNKQRVQSIEVRVRDPKGKDIYTQTLKTDEFEGVQGSLKLGDEPALGMYRIYIKADAQPTHSVGNLFRVEEYKKPEFEVTVEPGKPRVKLGEQITAVIRAKYYFGAPVTNARVKYKVFRTSYEHRYARPGQWDWLYGPGYGLAWYEYPWFGWWQHWGPKCCYWWPWWGQRPGVERELVQEGEVAIREDGSLEVSVDTGPALKDHPDTDHLYSIEAEVRDASRRTITGSGAVKATRNEFYVFVSTDRGYYSPGQQVFARVRTLGPDDSPRKAKGKVTLSRVLYTGENNATVTEQPFKTFDAETDDEGRLEIPLRTEQSGQIKIAFAALDSWGKPVIGATVVWVAGSKFDGRVYRFSDLELITDKRTYEPGEVVHLMINANRAGQWVIFSDDVHNGMLLSYRFIHLPQKSKVIDIPVKEGHVPNFFVEATCVSNGQVHQQAQQICVPPTKGLIELNVAYDRDKYRPGQTGTVTVSAKTPDGKPARTQVVVAAFDKSILYIQPELAGDIREFFWGQKRRHYPQMNTTLQSRFGVSQGRLDPRYQMTSCGLPESWNGSWGPRVQEWRVAKGKSLGMPMARSRRAEGTVDYMMTLPSLGGAPAAEDKAGVSLAMRAKKPAPAGGQVQLVKAEVRTDFADTALWRGALVTDPKTGTAKTQITFPDNLTTWKLNAHGMTKDTRVGAESASAVTTRNLIVRLQAPRFFVERDEVVLSANVHNYLASDKLVQVNVDLPGGCLELLSDKQAKVAVPAQGEARVDWVVRVKAEGTAVVKVEALTDEESDAVKMDFPVFVHGIEKTVSQCVSMRPDDPKGTRSIQLDVPAERDPRASRLEVRFSPSLAGAMLDAVPYLIAYPYGCIEQTVSRFMPAVLVKKTLMRTGLRLEDIRRLRANLDSQQVGAKDPDARWRRRSYCKSPVFDSDEMDHIVSAGLKRIYAFQKSDGGWGWWAGDESSPYQSAYVIQALTIAVECDVPVDQTCFRRGHAYLESAVAKDVKEWKEERKGAWNSQAYLAYVLSLGKAKNDDLLAILFERRDWLGLYGKALLCLTYHNLGDEAKARLLLRNIMQYAETDDENQTTWFKTPQSGWWFWWNNDIESNAYVLRALCALDPKSEAASRLVKWLLNNRRNGYYWRSTRDTALCVMAMADYMLASGESAPDYTLAVDYDQGKFAKSVAINAQNLFTFDNGFTLAGDALTGGRHVLKLTRQGKGALYASCYLTYFTKEEDITAAGLELKVERKYYLLERVPRTAQATGSRGQQVAEARVRYKRKPLNTGDRVNSGDLLEVELLLRAKNDYDYLVFEDMKPAGCEPVQVRSGARYGELCSNMELRDEKVVFFVGWLSQGEHAIRYRTRAEIPGNFHALPTKGWAMYAPEIRANSAELRLQIVDAPAKRAGAGRGK